MLSYLSALAESGREDELWGNALVETRKLADQLAETPGAASTPPDGNALFSLLDELRSRLEARATQLLQGKTGKDVQEVDLILTYPLLGAKLRADLWQAAQGLSNKLSEDEKQAQREDENTRKAASAALPSVDSSGTARLARAQRRAQLALDLLTLAEVPNLEAARGEWEKASNKSNPDELEPVATALRQAWVQLPDQVYNSKLGAATSERASWLLPLMDTSAANNPQVLPAILLRKDHLYNVRTWLAQQYRTEADHLEDLGRATQAGDFRRVASRLQQR
jgi:hypothetical protein